MEDKLRYKVKAIRMSEETWNNLKKLQKSGESWNKLLVRLLKRKPNKDE